MIVVLAALAGAVAIAVLGLVLRPRPGRVPVARTPRWRVPVVAGRPWQRRRGPTDVEVAAWCGRVARSTRAGSSLTQAIVEADDEMADRRPFPDVVHALGRGRSLADALAIDGAESSTAAGIVGPVLRACAEVGGPPAPPLDRAAGVLLARAAERDERAAGAAQARLSARVLTVVPFGVVALLVTSEPAIRTAITTVAGATCVIAGVVLNLLGRWWMATIIGASS